MKSFLFFFVLLFFLGYTPFAHQASQKKNVKRLFLVRHAKSSHDNPELKDFDRPLNDRGRKDAPAMGQRLHQMGILLDHIISSPSRRTRQTAQLMCEKMAIDFNKISWDQSIYRCASKVLRERIFKIDDSYNSVMIFGHNPAITSAANFFQKDSTIKKVPTTGIVAIEFETSHWSALDSIKGKLLFFKHP